MRDEDVTFIGWATLAIGVILVSLTILATGCSAGPQLPVITIPVNVSCTWNAPDGSQLEDNDCLVENISPATTTDTTGNDNRGARVDAELSTTVTP